MTAPLDFSAFRNARLAEAALDDLARDGFTASLMPDFAGPPLLPGGSFLLWMFLAITLTLAAQNAFGAEDPLRVPRGGQRARISRQVKKAGRKSLVVVSRADAASGGHA